MFGILNTVLTHLRSILLTPLMCDVADSELSINSAKAKAAGGKK